MSDADPRPIIKPENLFLLAGMVASTRDFTTLLVSAPDVQSAAAAIQAEVPNFVMASATSLAQVEETAAMMRRAAARELDDQVFFVKEGT
jgi:hypothetical protein